MKSEESGRYRRRGDVVVEGNTTVEQNLYVDGGASIDGKTEIGGNAHVSKNLKVDGFLDAPNIRGCSKGLFASREALVAAYPRPHKGWWAVVCSDLSGAASEGLLYICGSDEYEHLCWEDTGATCNLAGLVDQFGSIEASIEEIDKRLEDIDAEFEQSGDYVKTLAKAINDIGETVETLEGATVQEVSAHGSYPLSLYATTTDIVEDDKVVGKSVAINGDVAEATDELPGVMSAKDKALVDALNSGVSYFTYVSDGEPTIQSGVAPSYVGVYYFPAVNKFLCLQSGGSRIVYADWEASGAYQASSAYMSGDVPVNKLYVCGDGKAYMYDTYLQTLVLLGDTSGYDEDRRKLGFAYGSLASGRVNNGTERFNGVYDSSETTCVFYDDAGGDFDGIVWLCDKKMFVAYKAAAVSGNGCTEAVWFFFYHWVTDYLYMENVGEEGGLWKDKLYIGVGHVWMWKTCSKNLELAGAAGDYRVATDEEVEALAEDFVFVDPSAVSGIVSIDLQTAAPLEGSVVYDETSGEAIMSLSLAEASEEEVDNIFGKNE